MTRWERVTSNLRDAREALRLHRRGCDLCLTWAPPGIKLEFPCPDLEALRAKVEQRVAAKRLARQERTAR